MADAAMREQPPDVSNAEVLTALRDGWALPVESVEHLPVGFGAHHWRADIAGRPRLFATLDTPGRHHTAASLEAVYAAAAVLATSGLDFVVAGIARRDGRYTRPLGHRVLSVTGWLATSVAGEGTILDANLAGRNAEMLARLHATPAPEGTPLWTPRVGPDLPDLLASATADAWSDGPYGERARRLLIGHRVAIESWTARYHELVVRARSVPWVPTHGEPHTANQMITSTGPVLVDWETLALAPRERDLTPLVQSGFADLVQPDQPMIEMFDLEWRLDEIAQFATWFAGPHDGTEDDRIAFAGLVSELRRPAWIEPD
jgi:spectinomycin phosphotransferase